MNINYILGIIISGLVYGTLYALAALGIVIIYRATKVLNFAHGAIGISATMVMVKLVTMGVNIYLAFFIAVLTGATIGFVVKLSLQLVPKKYTLSRVMITVGWMQGLIGLLKLVFGAQLKQVPSLFPIETVSILNGTLNVGVDQIYVIITALLLCFTGYYVIKKTNFGRALRAVSENEEAAKLMGINSNFVVTVAWMIGGAFATIAVIMLTRYTALDFDGIPMLINFTSIAATMVGGLISLPLTLLGGIAIGVIQALTKLDTSSIILKYLYHATPFIIVILALLIHSKLLLKMISSKKLIVSKFRMIEIKPKITKASIIKMAIIAVIVIVFPFYFSSYWTKVITMGLIYSIAILSIVVLTGMLGKISFAQAAFMGVGGYTYALLTTTYGWMAVPAIITALLITVFFSLVIALPSLKFKGLFLAIATFTFQFMLDKTLFLDSWFAGGFIGRKVARPTILFIDLSNRMHFYFFVVALVLLAYIFVRNLPFTKMGRDFRAIRDGEDAAKSLGVNVQKAKILGFAISSLMAGATGILYAIANGSVVGGQGYNIGVSIVVLVMAVLLGIRSPIGAIIAGLFIYLPGSLIQEWFPSSLSASQIVMTVSGFILIANLIQYPNGLAQIVSVFKTKSLEKRLRKGGVVNESTRN